MSGAIRGIGEAAVDEDSIRTCAEKLIDDYGAIGNWFDVAATNLRDFTEHYTGEGDDFINRNDRSF